MRCVWILSLVAACSAVDGTDDTTDDSATDPVGLGPLTDADDATDEVLEALPAGTEVGLTLVATDPDVDDVITYALTDDADGRFAVDPATGVVTTAKVLDHETASSWAITGEATSTDGSTASASFTIAVADDLPPELAIAFPQAGNFLGDVVDVSGTVTDPEGRAVAVTVAVGTSAADATVDGDAWSLEDLALPDAFDRTLTVTATDAAGETSTATVALTSGVWMPYPRAVVVDPDRDVAYVATNDARIIAFDLATGARRIHSGAGVGNGTPTFGALSAIAFDADGDVLYVTDRDREVVFAVDPDTGDRTVVASNTLGTGDAFDFYLTECAFDAANDRLLIVNRNILYALDPSTGNRTILSSADVGTGLMYTYDDVVVDPGGTVAYGFESRDLSRQPHNPIVFEIDLTTGDRTELSTRFVGSGPLPSNAESIALDTVNDRIVLADTFAGALIALDPETSVRTVLSSGTVGTGVAPSQPLELTFADGEVFVVDGKEGGVYGVASNGDRSLYATSSVGRGPHFWAPRALDVSADGTRAVVADARPHVDQANEPFDRYALVDVDLATGDRTLVSGYGLGAGPDLLDVRSIAWDEANDRVLVLDNEAGALLSVDLSTGDRTLVSDDSRGTGPTMDQPEGLVLDGTRAFVGVSFLGDGGSGIAAVDLSTGDRTQITGDDVGTGSSVSTKGLAWDASNGVLIGGGYIGTDKGVFEVDVATGNRAPISTTSAWKLVSGIALDPAGGVAWVSDVNDFALARVDLAQGTREERSNPAVGGGERPLTWRDVAWWPGRGPVVVDQSHPALILVDPVSGDRVTISK